MKKLNSVDILKYISHAIAHKNVFYKKSAAQKLVPAR